ncbi:MAG TPA: hypothetical protein PLI28_10110 [Petrotogaceae bacterium]|nr:hypothetical protein [Petrotogaceae bacterium]
MKKLIVMSLLSFIIFISAFSFDILVNTSYSFTLDATVQTSSGIPSAYDRSQKLNYTGIRVSYLIPTEDSKEILYGPYIGFFYNLFDKQTGSYPQLNADVKDISYSMGLNVVYTSKLFQSINFDVCAYGGVHTDDNFKTYSTEILMSGGFNWDFLFINAGYDIRYCYVNKNNTIAVNSIPITLGVSFKF